MLKQAFIFALIFSAMSAPSPMLAAEKEASFSAELTMNSDELVAGGPNGAKLTIKNTGVTTTPPAFFYVNLPQGFTGKILSSDCDGRIVGLGNGEIVVTRIRSLLVGETCKSNFTITAPSTVTQKVDLLKFSINPSLPSGWSINTTINTPKIKSIFDPSKSPGYSAEFALDTNHKHLVASSHTKGHLLLKNTGKGIASAGLILTLPQGFSSSEQASSCGGRLLTGEHANEIALENLKIPEGEICEAHFNINVSSSGTERKIEFSIRPDFRPGTSTLTSAIVPSIEGILDSSHPELTKALSPQHFITHDITFPLVKDEVESFDYDVIINSLLDADSIYYFIQQWFSHEGTYYSGIKPHANGTADFAFSYFGKNATPEHTNCRDKADSHDGVTCSLTSVPYKVGEKFSIQIKRIANNSESQTYSADLVATDKTYVIGSWKIPAANGHLKSGSVSVVEKYSSISTCADIPKINMTYQNFVINKQVIQPKVELEKRSLSDDFDVSGGLYRCTFFPRSTEATAKEITHGYQISN